MKLIGDPHIGREFKANVPLDRRGEREEMLLSQFERELCDLNESLIVVVGDLFEHWFISYEALYRTLRILNEWQPAHPLQQIVILQGNHDYSPAEGVYGAFDVLDLALQRHPSIHVVRRPTTLYGVMFFPWQWNRTALEQLDDVHDWTDTAVGHWDLVDYGGDNNHMCPAKELHARGVIHIYSGHWHIAGDYDVDGHIVSCTGSMQPMNHAEDPDGRMYITLTLDEYNRTDPDKLSNNYIRVIAPEGSDVSPPPTCLGFKVQKLKEEREPEERVSLDGFDMKKILEETLAKHEVPEPVATKIKGRLNDLT